MSPRSCRPWAALRNRAFEAWPPGLALVLLPGGALLAALRAPGELEPAGAAVAYIGALLLLVCAGLAVLRATERPMQA
jgi:hypothetical protein